MPGIGSIAVPKVRPGQLSRLQAKQQRRTQEALEIRMCYRAVDERDGGRCRVCKKRGHPQATTLLDRLHRHHLIYRSRGGTHEPENVVTVCASCHDAMHVDGTLRLEGDANARDAVTNKLAGVCAMRLLDGVWQVEKWC
jgi:5-methylcytosine-specific restriction endonuclease McrA